MAKHNLTCCRGPHEEPRPGLRRRQPTRQMARTALEHRAGAIYCYSAAQERQPECFCASRGWGPRRPPTPGSTRGQRKKKSLRFPTLRCRPLRPPPSYPHIPLLCPSSAFSHPRSFSFAMSTQGVTIRTRKFLTNRLLSRRQMVCFLALDLLPVFPSSVLHPRWRTRGGDVARLLGCCSAARQERQWGHVRACASFPCRWMNL